MHGQAAPGHVSPYPTKGDGDLPVLAAVCTLTVSDADFAKTVRRVPNPNPLQVPPETQPSTNQRNVPLTYKYRLLSRNAPPYFYRQTGP